MSTKDRLQALRAEMPSWLRNRVEGLQRLFSVLVDDKRPPTPVEYQLLQGELSRIIQDVRENTAFEMDRILNPQRQIVQEQQVALDQAMERVRDEVIKKHMRPLPPAVLVLRSLGLLRWVKDPKEGLTKAQVDECLDWLMRAALLQEVCWTAFGDLRPTEDRVVIVAFPRVDPEAEPQRFPVAGGMAWDVCRASYDVVPEWRCYLGHGDYKLAHDTDLWHPLPRMPRPVPNPPTETAA